MTHDCALLYNLVGEAILYGPYISYNHGVWVGAAEDQIELSNCNPRPVDQEPGTIATGAVDQCPVPRQTRKLCKGL